MDKYHHVTKVSFRGDRMLLSVDGQVHDVGFAPQSYKLAKASEAQRNNFVVSPSGYGIHWPELDEDLSIDGLLGIKHAAPLLNRRIS